VPPDEGGEGGVVVGRGVRLQQLAVALVGSGAGAGLVTEARQGGGKRHGTHVTGSPVELVREIVSAGRRPGPTRPRKNPSRFAARHSRPRFGTRSPRSLVLPASTVTRPLWWLTALPGPIFSRSATTEYDAPGRRPSRRKRPSRSVTTRREVKP